jgi:hypothetical protein
MQSLVNNNSHFALIINILDLKKTINTYFYEEIQKELEFLY